MPLNTLYLAHILDDFNLLLWSFSKGATSSNKPKSIAEDLMIKPPKKTDIESFKSGADFERRRAEIIKRITNHKNTEKAPKT